MNIAEEVEFDKDGHIERYSWLKKFFLSLVIILVALLSFGFGMLLEAGERDPIQIEYDPSLSSVTYQTASAINSVIASKNGKKYHYSHCPGSKQISEANKIVFASPEAAEASGYTLATNCKKR